MATRVAFHTFGCRLNQAETASLEQCFSLDGYEVVTIKDDPEIMVINTCTVTKNADADTRKLLHRLVRRNPAIQIALIGCQAQLQAKELARFANVRWVVGNGQKMELPSILANSSEDSKVECRVDEIPHEPFSIPVTGIDRRHTRANLKIQDGCDFYCLFCVIPYARGRARSRQFNNIINEAKRLVDANHKELVITGVNIGTYEHLGKRFIDVIRQLLSIDDLRRLRISSIEPTTIPNELLPLMHSESVLCRYLHIPLQSGNDHILFKMNRRYTTAQYRAFLDKAAAQVQDICLGTDVIVGYPGETDAYFDDTVDLLRQLPFAYFHVFSYSERQEAKSKRFADQVDKPTIQRRSAILRALSRTKKHQYQERFLGSIEYVLFEHEKNDYWLGLTDTYNRVKVQSKHKLDNSLLPVKLEEIEGDMILGRLA